MASSQPAVSEVPVFVSRQSEVVSEDSISSLSLRGLQSTSDEFPDPDSDSRTKSKDKKGFFSPRRAGALLNMFSASHRHKNSELHKIFTSLPETELLIDDYSCALQRDILIHGRLYLTQRWVCFYANIFSWETLLTIPFQSVQGITKEKTALVIPNAIQISTTTDKYGFSSLGNRDMTYNIVFKCWQNVLLNQAISPLGLVQAARKARGESTDVGTEHDLWGRSKDSDLHISGSMSLPTHLEIGLLPPTTLPPEHPPVENVSQSASEGSVVKDSGATAASADLEQPDSSPALLSRPSGDVISIGGESIASSEYETISLFEETGEVLCGCSEHLGRTIINELYDCDVETIFQLIFTDTEFIRVFFKGEKKFNMSIGDWVGNTDGSKDRDISYTIALNYSFGPKFCHTTEHQIYSKMGQPGIKHIVDADVVNHNIPYSDTFYVACRYCITRVATRKSRLRITANIKFKKSCWGLIKNLIERNVGDGVGTHYTHMDAALKEHIITLPEKTRRQSGRRHRQRRPSKRPTPPTRQPQSIVEESPQNSLADKPPPVVTAAPHKEVPRINLALTLLLGILVASNVLLYQQLTGYNLTTPSKPFPPHDRYEWPSTQDGWISLVNELANQKRDESQDWNSISNSIIQEMDKVEVAVGNIKKLLLNEQTVQSECRNKQNCRKPPSIEL